jgi:hypothetical protein
VNQRLALARRKAELERLYSADADADVIILSAP